MKSRIFHFKNQLQVYIMLACLVCVQDISVASELIATIGQPLFKWQAFLENNTILRIAPKQIQIVDADTGNVVDVLLNLTYGNDLVFSSNTSHFAILSYSYTGKIRKDTVEIWDVNARQKLAEWEIENGDEVVAFSPTHPVLAISGNREIYLWNWQTGEQVGSITGNLDDNTVTFTPDGRHLIAVSNQVNTNMWDVETFDLVGHFDGNNGSRLDGVAISPDGKYIAAFDEKQEGVYVWNMDSRDLLWDTKSGKGEISEIAFSPDSQQLYVATKTSELHRRGYQPWTGWDDKVRVWDAKSGQLIDTISTEFVNLDMMILSPDGRTVLLQYSDAVVLWDIEKKKSLQVWGDFVARSCCSAVKLSPDGKTVVGLTAHFIKVWDVASQQMRILTSADGYMYEGFAISPDSKKIAVIKEPWVEIVDIQTGRVETQIYPESVWFIRDVTFSSSGRWLTVAGGRDLVIFDMQNLDNPQFPQRNLESGTIPGYDKFTFSQDDKYLAASAWPNNNNDDTYWMLLWKREGETFIFQYAWVTPELEAPPAFGSIDDGSRVLAAPGEEDIQIWELLSDKPQMLATLDGEGPAQFSPDGRYLFASAQIWDWQTSKPVNNPSYPSFEDISQDGSVLLSYTIPGQYHVYDIKHTLTQLPTAVETKGRKLVTLGQIKRNQLLQNFPNPFNPETWIPFQLAKNRNVTIQIYTPTGNLVRTLSLGMKSAGNYSSQSKAIHWDGRNNQGEPVSSGIYLYTINAGDFSATRKMLIRK